MDLFTHADDAPSYADLLGTLPKKEQRGSRARCVLLTDGPSEVVAKRLSGLADGVATVDPERDFWMPRGFAEPREGKLGKAPRFLSDEQREAVTAWWLVVRKRANTPNWDIASTANIDGSRGLLLVEAKAHQAELKTDGKTNEGRPENHARIQVACREASDALNRIRTGWTLSTKKNYQLCNRFVWAWKLASLRVPVVLVYLGFLRAEEMRVPFADAEQWDHLVRDHSKGVVPGGVWDSPTFVNGTPLCAKISSREVPLLSATTGHIQCSKRHQSSLATGGRNQLGQD